MNCRGACRTLFLLIAVATAASDVYSQQYMRPGTVELSASTGGTFDLPSATAHTSICRNNFTTCREQNSFGRKSLPMVSGGVAVALNRSVWFYGDYSYVLSDHGRAFLDATPSDPLKALTTAYRQYWMASGGVEFSFPTIHGVVPLLRVGIGGLHHKYNYDDDALNFASEGFHFADNETMVAGTFGGGLRWYLGERQGLRLMVNGLILGQTVAAIQPRHTVPGDSPFAQSGVAFVTRRSAGFVTIGYFVQFGR